MISKINHTKITVAQQIRAVFQLSYAVEAELLQAVDFPPLKRTVNDFLESTTSFYAYFQKEEMAAVLELKQMEKHTHIQSLVVNPKYFRQGIGSQLVAFALADDVQLFIVETGVDNIPAIRLYEKFGFQETHQWDTNHGVRKVKFEIKKDI